MLTVKQDFSDAIEKKIDRDISSSTYFFLTLKSISQKLEDPSIGVNQVVNSIKDALLISPDKDRVAMIELVSGVASQNDRAKDVFVDTLENCACDYDHPKTCLAATKVLCDFLIDGYTFKKSIIEKLHDNSLCDNQKISLGVLNNISRLVQGNEFLAPAFVATAEKALQSDSNVVLEAGCFLAADISSKKKEYADQFLPHVEALIDRKNEAQIAQTAMGILTLAKSIANLPIPYARRGFDLLEKTIKAIPEHEEESLSYGYLQLGQIVESSECPKVAKRAVLIAQEGSFHNNPSVAYASKLAVLVYVTKYEPDALTRPCTQNVFNKPRALIS